MSDGIISSGPLSGEGGDSGVRERFTGVDREACAAQKQVVRASVGRALLIDE